MTSNRSDPRVLQSICEEGLALHRAGRLAEAATQYEQVIKHDPAHADALHLLGVLHLQFAQIDSAIDLLKKAVNANPAFAPAQANLGMALFRALRYEEALTCYEAALALKSDMASALAGRGVVLGELERREEALESLRYAALLEPKDPDVHFNIGVQLHHLRRNGEAQVSLEQAIALRPSHAKAHHNLGTTLAALRRPAEAMDAYDRSIALEPAYAEAHNNRGLLLSGLMRHDEALESFNTAIKHGPDYAEAHFNRSLALLTTGDLATGFCEYQWRKALPRFENQGLVPGVPIWAGEDLSDKSILICCEQGFGDNLQFVRYVKPLSAVAKRVDVVAPGPLIRLFKSITDVNFIAQSDGRGYDYQALIMDLPGVFGTTLQTVPGTTPYLFATAEDIAAWNIKLGPSAEHMKVGLVWAGDSRKHNPDAFAIDSRRSIALNKFEPFAAAPGTRFISLQKGGPSEQARNPPPGMDLIDITEDLSDFADTAALIMNLDLVISVDTSVAHLVGALGKPLWILSRFDGCWRWLNHREDSPWYPTARIFHQRAQGEWGDPIERAATALMHRAGNFVTT